MASVYQFPEEFYLDENIRLYERARLLCRRYKLPYAEARKKHFEEQNRMYPEGEK